MSKTNSELFHGTSGSRTLTLLGIDEPTASVWDHIKPTADNYANSSIPRSFEVDVPKTVDTPQGKMWTHGNATEHMYETLISTKNKPPALKNSHPNLYAQFILYDYYQSLAKAVSSGITYEKIITSNSWEFIFSKPREKGKNPVVKHAQFRGI